MMRMDMVRVTFLSLLCGLLTQLSCVNAGEEDLPTGEFRPDHPSDDSEEPGDPNDSGYPEHPDYPDDPERPRPPDEHPEYPHVPEYPGYPEHPDQPGYPHYPDYPDDGGYHGTRRLKVIYEGSPNNSFSEQRWCEGSPVQRGDHGPDWNADFLPWPDQRSEPDLDTWRSMGDDVVNSPSAYAEVVEIPWGSELRFQCYDVHSGGHHAYGCDGDGVHDLRVIDLDTGREIPIGHVVNLTGQGVNCQTDLRY